MGNNKTRNPKSPTIKDPPIELKIKPKACALCGKPYIPTGPRAKFCPKCRELPKGKRDASLFAKHAELAFGPGPWATYKPEPVQIPDSLQMALDTARMLAHEVETQGLHICRIGTNYKDHHFRGKINVTPETFYKIFDEIPFEYVADGTQYKLQGFIDGVEVYSWLL